MMTKHKIRTIQIIGKHSICDDFPEYFEMLDVVCEDIIYLAYVDKGGARTKMKFSLYAMGEEIPTGLKFVCEVNGMFLFQNYNL